MIEPFARWLVLSKWGHVIEMLLAGALGLSVVAIFDLWENGWSQVIVFGIMMIASWLSLHHLVRVVTRND